MGDTLPGAAAVAYAKVGAKPPVVVPPMTIPGRGDVDRFPEMQVIDENIHSDASAHGPSRSATPTKHSQGPERYDIGSVKNSPQRATTTVEYEGDSTTCTLCTNEFEADQRVCRLKSCSHIFHASCWQGIDFSQFTHILLIYNRLISPPLLAAINAI